MTLLIAPTKPGLSPRVRGNLIRFGTYKSANGSIPACAGEPICVEVAFCKTKVYPRVCGGTNSFLSPFFVFRGLSPRVRGNRNQSASYSL